MAIDATSPVPNDDGNGIDAHTFSRGSRHQEETRSQRSQPPAKAAVDEFVSSVEIPAEIMWQQKKTDDNASHNVSNDNLQKCEIGIVGEAGNADDGKSAGLGGNNRKRDRPPWNLAIGQEVIAQSSLTLAKAQAEQSDPHKIERDDREIKFV